MIKDLVKRHVFRLFMNSSGVQNPRPWWLKKERTVHIFLRAKTFSLTGSGILRRRRPSRSSPNTRSTLLPYLAPADYFLYPTIKRELGGVSIRRDMVRVEWDRACRRSPPDCFTAAFDWMIDRLRKCVEVRRNYIEVTVTGRRSGFLVRQYWWLINDMLLSNSRLILSAPHTLVDRLFILLVFTCSRSNDQL